MSQWSSLKWFSARSKSSCSQVLKCCAGKSCLTWATSLPITTLPNNRSGGAQTKILHFIENLHVIKDNLFEVPPLFKLIQEQSQTDWKEMYQVFNCGHRMELYVDESIANDIIAISESFGIAAQIVGRVEASESKKLTIKSEYGIFEY